MKKRIILLVVIVVLVGTGIFFYARKNGVYVPGNKKDDWVYNPKKSSFSSSLSSSGIGATRNAGVLYDSASSLSLSERSSISSSVSGESNIGFSTGGAKNVENFRENIKNGYFPISTDITYNGLFYDYSFDTGNVNESKELFSPSYCVATSKDPISNELEYYMSVGLNSNIKESDFARKKLNLVVVLDISGSMSSSFNSYYYDGKKKDKEESKSKMKLASESLNILIDNLKDDDRLGIVLFDDEAYLAKDLNYVGNTDIDALKEHILEIEDRGGTNFEAGYKKGTKLFNGLQDSKEYDNRIIVITDAMPNYGTTSNEGLLKYVTDNSDEGIYTTFIGVGVDFNTKLVEQIGSIKGANYYSVNSASEFKETMKEDFEFMVTPLVFDLNLNFESKDYEIVNVYGTDAADKSKGNIMHVNTLFPSRSNSEGEVKGGIVLLKLKKKSNEDGKIKLSVSYKDRNGKDYSNSQDVVYDKTNEEYYANTGIRKAIVLSRYANTLKNWILYERSEEPRFLIIPSQGIMDCDYSIDEINVMLGEQERRSVSLSVSDEYKEVFKTMKSYINSEMEKVNDDTLSQEIEILDKLIDYKSDTKVLNKIIDIDY